MTFWNFAINPDQSASKLTGNKNVIILFFFLVLNILFRNWLDSKPKVKRPVPFERNYFESTDFKRDKKKLRRRLVFCLK